MRKILLFLVFFLIQNLSIGQTNDTISKNCKHEASFDMGSFYTSVLSKDLYGFYFDVKYYAYKRFATGVTFATAQKKIEDTFSYTIGQPILNYYEIGWINQYDLVHKDNFRISAQLTNGIAITRLGDNDDKERYWTKYGYQYRSKAIATNNFYLLEPGMDASIRVFSNKHYPDFYLSAKAKYRFVFGGSSFGQLNDFNNAYFGIGLSIIGFTDNESQKQ